jgi:LuxR family glucitol operon transcriptional activator
MINERFAYLLSEGIRSVALRMKRPVRDVEVELANVFGYTAFTIHRWRRGNVPRDSNQVMTLIKYCAQYGRLNIQWGRSLLLQTNYPHLEALLADIWPHDNDRGTAIIENLPEIPHKKLIGREGELKNLLSLLSADNGAHFISVSGLGGVGKTALVLEAARLCLTPDMVIDPDISVPAFDTIIFLSAERSLPATSNSQTRYRSSDLLQSFFRKIAVVLNRRDIMQVSHVDQPRLVREALSRQRNLLIVDGLDTWAEENETLSFLFNMPLFTKVVLTTGEQAFFSPIHLDTLPERQARELILWQAGVNGLRRKVSASLIDDIYRWTEGSPALIIRAVEQMAANSSPQKADMLMLIRDSASKTLWSYLDAPIASLEEDLFMLLAAQSLFIGGASSDAIASVAGLEDDLDTVHRGLASLVSKSLLNFREGRYDMPSSTRRHILDKLKSKGDIVRKLRERWIDWYLRFVTEYGGSDELDWHIKYDKIEEEWSNLLAVFSWCKVQIEEGCKDKYKKLKAFWGPQGVQEFANVYGYWTDRLTWLTYISCLAERYGELSTLIQSLRLVAWTKIVIAQHNLLEEAREDLNKAWQLSRREEDRLERSMIACYRGCLHTRIGEYELAHRYFKEASDLIKSAQNGGGAPTRDMIVIQYHRAEVYYHTNPTHARNLYKDLLLKVREIGWKRADVYIQNWLADLAIDRREYDEASRLIGSGIDVAKQNKDARRIAHFTRSLANLKYQQNDLKDALRYAKEALNNFEHLGMQEAEEMRHLVAKLSSSFYLSRTSSEAAAVGFSG